VLGHGHTLAKEPIGTQGLAPCHPHGDPGRSACHAEIGTRLSIRLPASWSGARDTKVFVWAAATTVLVVVGSVAWVELRIGGDQVTTAFDDIGEGVAALVAATCCTLTARRNTGRARLGWTLLAASAATWCAGETVWSIYEVGMGISVPYPSAADVGFLGAIPLAAAGIVCFFAPARGTSTRLRLWLDGAIVFLALFFVAWTLGLKSV